MTKLFTNKVWDSDFFKRTILTIDLDSLGNKVESWPKNSLITVKVDANKYQSLEHINKYDFSFVEGELVFKKAVPVNLNSTSLTDFDSYLATESSLDELKLIVSDLYVNSRFREPWFTLLERDRFYQKWIENAVLAKFDDCCLVLKEENTISGFVTVRIRCSEATIGLIGVATPFQGKGVGKKLLELVQNYSTAKKAKIIKVATQTSNISAANLYGKNGFTITDISYWFYKQV
ncbi:GNAT family N-acetyltransferase [Pseudoalteromonas lipolytica]|uniref:GNAT family N-acetyltransferase n=1 Tax=Pseudoalteromonas lipolytica TaxID=570156 RepID=A0AAD0S2T8_9GAMM|nr:GNAT family N-acetyltransferase [Pseudoalteromonas donghaensis]AXV66464.1 GNAT family N-acetyltransferase [Pseudoalteromonas donghaensis]